LNSSGEKRKREKRRVKKPNHGLHLLRGGCEKREQPERDDNAAYTSSGGGKKGDNQALTGYYVLTGEGAGTERAKQGKYMARMKSGIDYEGFDRLRIKRREGKPRGTESGRVNPTGEQDEHRP